MKSTLYYVLDPMCSWCWGFHSTFSRLLQSLPPELEVQFVMGGLAQDSDEPMPIETQAYIQEQWRLVTKNTGAEFNWDFWEKCQPRRSTYPACRAVIAAGLQGCENTPKMIAAIQYAYYQQARNPSDQKTLIELAGEIGLDTITFSDNIQSKKVETLLQKDFEIRRKLGVNSFPTVLLATSNTIENITRGQHSLAEIQSHISKILA